MALPTQESLQPGLKVCMWVNEQAPDRDAQDARNAHSAHTVFPGDGMRDSTPHRSARASTSSSPRPRSALKPPPANDACSGGPTPEACR